MRWKRTGGRRAALALAGAVVLALAACGDEPAERAAVAPGVGFAGIEAAAQGQTVRFWMYGGDAKVNDYVDDAVAPAAERRGVTIKRVPVADTADAVRRIVAERRAGKRSGGGVDLVWINGENFAAGKQNGLWLEDWATKLPNARRYVDAADPAIAEDFGVPTDGQESPWQSARFVFAHDRERTPRPPRDLDALLAYARANPGRVTYPAPPDFTGSAFVRQVVAAKGEEAAFAYLEELKPLMHRRGRSFPKSQAELDVLFGNGQVDFAMAYDANFVNAGVRKGTFPKTARPFVLGGRTLTNTSYVTIPRNAANREAAQVVADVLLDPELQAAKARPDVLGNPTVLDLDKLGRARDQFGARDAGPYVLTDFGRAVPELAADAVAPLEQRWVREVLR